MRNVNRDREAEKAIAGEVEDGSALKRTVRKKTKDEYVRRPTWTKVRAVTSNVSLACRRLEEALFAEVGSQGEGNDNTVIKLLRDGVDPNAKSGNKTHPLYEAAKHGHASCITQLLKAGAEVDAHNSEVRWLTR